MWTSFNLLELAIFKLFDNFTWYCDVGILFERQHDIGMENCSNNFFRFYEQKIYEEFYALFYFGQNFCHFSMLRCDLPRYNTMHWYYHKIWKSARNYSGTCEKIVAKLGNSIRHLGLKKWFLLLILVKTYFLIWRKFWG